MLEVKGIPLFFPVRQGVVIRECLVISNSARPWARCRKTCLCLSHSFDSIHYKTIGGMIGTGCSGSKSLFFHTLIDSANKFQPTLSDMGQLALNGS